MSFTNMHNDYLDPDKYCTETSEAEFDMDALLTAAKKWDSGRWSWDRIHICLTGKNGDLDPCGQQGIEIVSCDDEGVLIRVHAGKTVAGLDVSLAVDYDTDEEHQAALDEYLDIATEIVCGTEYPGEWSGDDWYIHHSEDIRVAWVKIEDGYDYDQTIADCVEATGPARAAWEDAMQSGRVALDRHRHAARADYMLETK